VHKSEFFKVEFKAHLVPNRLLHPNARNTYYLLLRKPTLFEAAVSSTLFSLGQ